MGKTSATSIDASKVAKTGDTMTGTLVVPSINQDTGTTPDATSPVNVTGSTHHRYPTPSALQRYEDVAGWAPTAAPAATGTLKITLPKSWSNTQLVITLRGFSYASPYEHWTMQLSGYSYSTTPAWLYARARIHGDTGFGNKVRFGHDGTKLCILLGDLTTPGWTQYHFIALTEVLTNFQNTTGWGSGWSIDVITSEAGITNIVDADTSFIFGGVSKPAALTVSGTTTLNGPLQVVRPAGSSSLQTQRNTGDTQYRYSANVDGLMSWGDGTSALDTNLYRTSAGVLKSDGAINAVNGFQVNGVGLGAWTAYTPTLTGTGWALGNAAVDATYARIGKTVYYRVQIVWGSTSTFGSVQPIVSLPSTMVSAVHGAGTSTAIDVGTTFYHWDVYYTSSTTVKPVVRGVDGATTNTPTGTVPFAWASGDALLIHGWYQEA